MVVRDRRGHKRVEMARACKLFVAKTGKYLSGITWNLSAAGALLEVKWPADLQPGDRLFLGIALKRRQAVVLANEMLDARIVRSLWITDDREVLGVQFVKSSADWAAARQAA